MRGLDGRQQDLPALQRNNIYFMEPLFTIFKNWSWLEQDSILISAEFFNDRMIEVKYKGKNTGYLDVES